MLKTLFRKTGAAILAASFGLCAVPAMADDGTAGALSQTSVIDASQAIKNAMNASQAKTTEQKRIQSQQVDQSKALPNGSIAQVPPIQQSPVGAQQGLPTGFTYMGDFSMALPFGNIGSFQHKMLPGGADAVFGYGFNPTTRFLASMYQIQHYPVGFNSGTVPLYLQGFQNPIGSVNLADGPQSNLSTKDTFYIFNLEKLFILGKVKGRAVPLVITPTYVARTSTIAASGNGTDQVPFEPNFGKPGFGFPLTGVATRSAQIWSVGVTAPFLKTPKMFGTFTVAPGWLGQLNGVNQVNHAQLYQILYLEYNPTNNLRFFLEPQSSRDYLPTDYYAQHLIAYFLGASQRIDKNFFAQVVLNSGGPTNESPYGITALTCQALPCSQNPVVPTIGGLKATQIQLQIGIGSPTVIPF